MKVGIKFIRGCGPNLLWLEFNSFEDLYTLNYVGRTDPIPPIPEQIPAEQIRKNRDASIAKERYRYAPDRLVEWGPYAFYEGKYQKLITDGIKSRMAILALVSKHKYDDITDINFSNNGLKVLPRLPNSLLHLRCYNNQLTELPEILPEGLQTLDCMNNHLTHLPKKLPSLGRPINLTLEEEYELPCPLITINCMCNRITHLPEIPNTVKSLNMHDNELTEITGISRNSKIMYMIFSKNNIMALDRTVINPKFFNRLILHDNPIMDVIDNDFNGDLYEYLRIKSKNKMNVNKGYHEINFKSLEKELESHNSDDEEDMKFT